MDKWVPNQFNACKRKVNVSMTKYDQGIYLPSHSLTAAQSLQNLDLEGSRTALRLINTNTPSNTNTYKQTMEIN